MKNRILLAFLAVLMILPMMFGVVSAADVNHYTDKFENEEAKIASMELASTSKNGKYELYCDKKSGELAVKNTESGVIFLSNPYDISQKGMSNDIM